MSSSSIIENLDSNDSVISKQCSLIKSKTLRRRNSSRISSVRSQSVHSSASFPDPPSEVTKPVPNQEKENEKIEQKKPPVPDPPKAYLLNSPTSANHCCHHGNIPTDPIKYASLYLNPKNYFEKETNQLIQKVYASSKNLHTGYLNCTLAQNASVYVKPENYFENLENSSSQPPQNSTPKLNNPTQVLSEMCQAQTKPELQNFLQSEIYQNLLQINDQELHQTLINLQNINDADINQQLKKIYLEITKYVLDISLLLNIPVFSMIQKSSIQKNIENSKTDWSARSRATKRFRPPHKSSVIKIASRDPSRETPNRVQLSTRAQSQPPPKTAKVYSENKPASPEKEIEKIYEKIVQNDDQKTAVKAVRENRFEIFL